MTCEACRTIPPVTATGYSEKGTWVELGGFKTYATGPSTAKKAIVIVYDLFGPASQTLQGADGLALATDFIVYVPDFLQDSGYAKSSHFGSEPLSPEAEKEKTAVFAAAMDFPKHVAALSSFITGAKKENPSVEAWGSVGLCWGGKVVALASFEGTPLKVSGQVHPGRLDAGDARKIAVPHVVLASKGEDKAVVDEYKVILEGRGYVEYYGTMHHGWMGARSNLEDPENAKEYERGYNKLASFFSEHM